MTLLSAALMGWLAAVPAERPVIVVQAPDAPVRLDRATVLQGTEGPPVVLYSWRFVWRCPHLAPNRTRSPSKA